MGAGNVEEGIHSLTGGGEDAEPPATVRLHQEPSQFPCCKEEDEAAAEEGGVLEEGGQIVHVGGAWTGGPCAHGPNDKVVADVPEQGASWPPHAEPAAEELGGGMTAIDDP